MILTCEKMSQENSYWSQRVENGMNENVRKLSTKKREIILIKLMEETQMWCPDLSTIERKEESLYWVLRREKSDFRLFREKHLFLEGKIFGSVWVYSIGRLNIRAVL